MLMAAEQEAGGLPVAGQRHSACRRARRCRGSGERQGRGIRMKRRDPDGKVERQGSADRLCARARRHRHEFAAAAERRAAVVVEQIAAVRNDEEGPRLVLIEKWKPAEERPFVLREHD